MADMSARNQKGSKVASTTKRPSKQEAPRVSTLTKEKARDGMASRITGSSTGRIQ